MFKGAGMKKILIFLFGCFFALSAFASDLSRAEKAISSGDAGLLDKMIAGGLDVNARDGNGDTLLFFALAATPDLTMAQKLVDSGADPDLPSTSGLTPLVLAASVAPALSENRRSGEGLTRYEKFQINHAEAMVRFLLKSGADIDKETPFGTPLMKAATSEENAGIVKMLLDAGAAVNKKDMHGRTALFYAAAFGCDNILTILLKAGADITVADEDGKSYMDATADMFVAEN